MILSQLLKVPHNTRFGCDPDYLFLHDQVALNTKTNQRINLDCSKPLRPQLGIDESLYIYTEINNIFRCYFETTQQTETYSNGITIRNLTSCIIGWQIYNKNKNIIAEVKKYIGYDLTNITVHRIDKTLTQHYEIFSKTIEPDKTLWKKTIWEDSWIKKVIFSHGVIMERDGESQPLKMTNPDSLPEVKG